MSSRIKEDVHKLFEFWCELTQTEKDAGKVTGVILESFPESFRDNQIIAKIPDFAYPCEFENTSVQSYSFVLTSDDSKWRFGFCRHDPKTQTAMVIITYLPWHDTFLKLLGVMSELRRTKNGEFESFLAEAYNKGVPDLGGSLKLFYNGGQNHFVFQRPLQFQLPSIPENHNLNLYYNFVDPKNMIAVFAAMLSERRIIFTSRRLDRLSSCIQAANAFLYPMVWQHIFIPIIPMKMKDILCAPIPYLIGVPEAVLHTMTADELGDVVILNCDNKTFQTPFDDVRQMPPELVSHMKKHLNNTNEHIGDRVSKIFLGVLVQLIGGYRDAAKYSQGEKITWDRDTFIESRPHHLRSFLTRMMELQIFQQFIDERMDILNSGQGFSDEFELETLRYTEKMGKRGKNYKEILRNVKDKLKPSNSMDYSGYRSARSGAPVSTPAHSPLESIMQTKQQQQQPDVPIGDLCIIDDDDENECLEKPAIIQSVFANHSLFDTPPDMPSPPIPPKRVNGSCGNLGKMSQSTFQESPTKNIINMSSSYAFENNFVNKSINLPANDKTLHHTRHNAPIPAPRHKQKESQTNLQKSPPETSKDLISLDESGNSSFDVEDFDPLNQNAKPIPGLAASASGFSGNKSTTLPSTSSSTPAMMTVHNPLYPYFSPQHRKTTQKPSTVKHETEDTELLRQYGLDKFHLTNGNAFITKPQNKSNWTTFDDSI